MTKDDFSRDKILQHINGFLPEMVAIRHDLHAHPELALEEHRTSGRVADLLEKWGYEVTRGIGKTGVVGTLRVGDGKKTIGIRADMDALPITEQTNLDYASKTDGLMHACGHDGHTTILLTAARYLAETRNFSGTLHLIFQPAEEGSAGAQLMINDGLFDKFPCDAIFGLHNWPGTPVGSMHFATGPMMASADTAYVTILGAGGHGAMPEKTIDPIVTSASTIMALQTIVSRNIAPLDSAIVSIGLIQGGMASNVIPDSVKLELTIRAFSADVRKKLEKRVCDIINLQAESYGAKAKIDYQSGYPVLVNHKRETEFAADVAEAFVGAKAVERQMTPVTPSEDFAFMLEKCPGSYLFLGNGDSAGLHSPTYVFDDALIPIGAGYWGALTETFLK